MRLSLSYPRASAPTPGLLGVVALLATGCFSKPSATVEGATLSTEEDTPVDVTLDAGDYASSATSYLLGRPPAHGRLSPPKDGKTTYTPDPDWSGTDTFTWHVATAKGAASPSAEVTIEVTPLNDAPVATSQVIDVEAGVPIGIPLTGTDAEGDDLTCTLGATSPAFGAVTMADCTAVYTPDADYTGTDAFTFSVADGMATSHEATITLHVTGTGDTGGTTGNHAPVAEAQDIDTPEDRALIITLVATDEDGDELRYAVPEPPRYGDVQVDGNIVHYTPDLNFSGPDSFKFTATDSHDETSEYAQIRIAVQDVEDAPVVVDGTANTIEDTTATFSLTASDPDRDETPTFAIVTQPAHGTASVSGSTVTFTPSADYNGSDSLRFTAADPAGNTSSVGTVALTIRAVNDAPRISNVTTGTEQEIAVSIPITAVDVDGDPVTLALGAAPTHGTRTLTGDTVTYTPSPGFYGTDTLGVTATDGTATGTGTITIEVVQVYTGITVDAQTLSTDEDTPVTTTITSETVDGLSVVSYRVVTVPAHGTATVNGDTVTYTPSANYTGTDLFTVAAIGSDGNTSPAGRFTVNIDGVNDAPSAPAATVSTAEDAPVTFTVNPVDPEGDSITIDVVTEPSFGGLSRSGNSFTFTPDPDWSGTDSFTWTASDGRATSPESTLTLQVVPVNDAPVSLSTSLTTAEDTPLEVDVTGADVEDGTTSAATIVAEPSHGEVEVADGIATYTPDPEYSGVDQFSYSPVDSEGLVGAPATVTLTITAVNDPPVPTVTTASVDANTNITIVLDATDAEGDTLTYALGTNATNGRVTVSGKNARYTPNTNYYGTDTFVYTVSDGNTTVSQTVTITVNNTVQGPEITVVSQSTTEDVAITFPLTATSPHGDALTYTLTSQPSLGTATLTGTNTITYQPNEDANGSDSFRWKVVDARGYSATSTATIIVSAVNDPPVANNGSATINEDTTVSAHMVANDVDSRAGLTYTIVTQPEHGVLTVTGANASYRPTSNYSGTDSFTWTANDGSADSNVATYTINVTEVPDSPTAYGSTLQTWAGHTADLVAQVTDPDSTAFTYTVDVEPNHGTLTQTSSGFTYEPDNGYYGRDHFTWHANDGGLDSDQVTSVLVIHPPTVFDRPNMPQIGFNKVQYGLGADDISIYTAEEQFWPETILEGFHDLGAQMQRQTGQFDLIWSTLEPSRDNWINPANNIVTSDDELESSVTLFTLQYASPTSPFCTDSADFAEGMTDEAYDYLDHVLDGYKDQVTSYEIGNEMYHWVAIEGSGGSGSGAEELPNCLPPDGNYTPTEQGGFIHDAAEYLKAGDSDAIVSLAAVNTNCDACTEWLSGVTTVAADKDWFDVVTYHGYDSWQRSYSTRDDFEDLMTSLGLEDKLVRLTEMGSSSDPDYTDRTDYPNSDDSQCADVFRLSLISWAGGTSTVIWHTYLPLTTGADYDTAEFVGYELLNYDGTLKPGAYAYKLLTTEVTPVQQITEYSRANSYVYQVIRSDGQVRWVMWGARDYAVPTGVTEYTSVIPNEDGSYTWTPVTPGTSMSLTDIPLLFR